MKRICTSLSSRNRLDVLLQPTIAQITMFALYLCVNALINELWNTNMAAEIRGHHAQWVYCLDGLFHEHG